MKPRYVIEYQGCFYTMTHPNWGVQFTPYREESEIFRSYADAKAKLDSWEGRFPGAEIVQL